MVDIHKELSEKDAFHKKVTDEFSEFEFPEEFITEIYTVINGIRSPQ